MPESDLLLYRRTKAVVVDFVAGLNGGQLAAKCPACPEWSIQDVVAHHVHVLTAAIAGSFPVETRAAIRTGDETERAHGAKVRDAWTSSGVAERAGLRLDELLDAWTECENVMTDENAWLLCDLSVHFDDLREAVAGIEPRQAPDIARTIEYFHNVQTTRLQNSGLQPVGLECSDKVELHLVNPSDWPIVRGHAYDLVRCLVSRRTRGQADETLAWGTCPEATRQAFPIYEWPV